MYTYRLVPYDTKEIHHLLQGYIIIIIVFLLLLVIIIIIIIIIISGKDKGGPSKGGFLNN